MDTQVKLHMPPSGELELTTAEFELHSAVDAARVQEARDRFWVATMAVLTAAANVSKLAWGSRGSTHMAERNALRSLLSLTPGSPLYSRYVRNHFEHSDERLFEYVDQLGQRPASPQMLAHFLFATDEEAAVLPVTDVFGRWNPDTDELTFWQDKVHVGSVVVELARVAREAETQLVRTT
ncbi:hypothetical protein [Kineococcus sp. R86509]|uniref:hypothetical protein n=1 Tax=Kineococcus sp. R86509 TaxID=3093851 RepID=UPI0036D3D256